MCDMCLLACRPQQPTLCQRQIAFIAGKSSHILLRHPMQGQPQPMPARAADLIQACLFVRCLILACVACLPCTHAMPLALRRRPQCGRRPHVLARCHINPTQSTLGCLEPAHLPPRFLVTAAHLRWRRSTQFTLRSHYHARFLSLAAV
jgi:hypothetical protein